MNKLAVIFDKIDPTQHPFLVRYFVNLGLELGRKWDTKGFSYQKVESNSSKNITYIDEYGFLNILRSFSKYLTSNKYQLKDYFRHDQINEFHPDILHFTNPNRYLKATRLTSTSGCKKVVSFRGSDILVFPHSRPDWKDALQIIFNEADILHFNCKKLQDEAVILGADKNKCRVIYRSVDPEFINADSHNFEKGSEIRLLSVGRLVWQKNHSSTLKAIQKLKEKEFDVHLDIVGDGEMRDQLQYETRSLGLGENVTFKGKMDRRDLKEAFKQSHFLIQSSVSEGIPNTILEALAANTPVITTSVGGISEVVKDCETGFIVPVDDADSLAQKVLTHCCNYDLLEKVSKNGSKLVTENFAVEHEIRNWVNLYTELV